jgi:hypothetical protein
MATLNELSRTQQTQQTSTQLGSRGAATTAVKSKEVKQLAGDLGAIEQLTKGASSLAKSGFEASEWADEKRAMDAKDATINGLIEIENQYDFETNQYDDNGVITGKRELTFKEVTEKKKWQKDFIKLSIESSLFSGDGNNDIYKEMFIQPITEYSAKITAANTSEQLIAYKRELIENTFNKIDNSNGSITIDEANVMIKDLRTTNKANPQDVVWGKIAQASAVQFAELSDKYIAGQTMNGSQGLTNLMDKGGYSQYLEVKDGIAKVQNGVEDKAGLAMLNNFNKERDSSIKRSIKSANDSVDISTNTYDTNKGGTAPNISVLNRDIDNQVKVLTGIENNNIYSVANRKKAKEAKQNLWDMKTMYKYSEDLLVNAVNGGNYTELGKRANHSVTYKDGQGRDILISSGFVTAYVNQAGDRMDTALTSMLMDTDQNINSYSKDLGIMYRLRESTGVESSHLIEMGQKFNSNMITPIGSVGEAKKMIQSAYMLSQDGNNQYQGIINKKQLSFLNSIINNTTLEDDAKLNAFNKARFEMKVDKDKVLNGSKANTKEALEYYNKEYGDTRMDASLLSYVAANDSSGKYKQGMTLDESYDMIQANTITYRIRDDGNFAVATLKTGASFFSDKFDGIVIPNNIGGLRNEKSITDGVKGFLRKVGRNMNEISVTTYSDGSVGFTDRNTGNYLGELNSKNIRTFSKEGRKDK